MHVLPVKILAYDRHIINGSDWYYHRLLIY